MRVVIIAAVAVAFAIAALPAEAKDKKSAGSSAQSCDAKCAQVLSRNKGRCMSNCTSGRTGH
jgi:hypothetical protein